MSYGFEVTNAAGEVLVNSDDPAFQIVADETLTGTAFGSFYQYDYVDSTALVFANLGVGDWIVKYLNYIYSNLASLPVRKVKPSNLLTDPTSGYGMVIYDATGDITYCASNDLMDINNMFILPANASTVSCSDTWFAVASNRPDLNDPFMNGTPGYLLATGVKRESATTIVKHVEQVGSGPPYANTSTDISVISAP